VQYLKRDTTAPALHQPGAEWLSRITSRGADDERKCRRKIKRVEANFALDGLLFVSVKARRPRSREPDIAVSRSSKSQPAARQRNASGRLMFRASVSMV
jgi:hypothetical protein